MSIKTLAAGLSVCTLFLLSSWQPGIAWASFTPGIDTNKNSIAAKKPLWQLKKKSAHERNGGLPNLLRVSQRSSSFRATHTRKTNRGSRPSRYQINRQNNPRFFQRAGRSKFSSPNLRAYSNRSRLSTKRSAAGTNKIRSNTSIFKRSKPRKHVYITPR